MDTIEKSRTHHQDRIDPDTECGSRILSEMNDPADDHRDYDQRKDEQFPLHQDRFTDEKDRTDRKRDQHHQVRRMKQFFLLCGDILITHRHPPCAWIPPLLL